MSFFPDDKPTLAEAEADETTQVLYEFNLTCGCCRWVTVDAETFEPPDGVYRCEECGAEERVPRGR